MPKLFYSPFHSFVHKVLVTAHECGLWDDIEFVPTFPYFTLEGEDPEGAFDMSAINPLSKVPTLVTETGQAIYGSQAVCEYLDANSKAGKMFPDTGPKRWDALTRMAVGDTIFETTTQMVIEQWQAPDQWNMRVFETIWPKYIRSLDLMDSQASDWKDFDIGHAALMHGMSYLTVRTEAYEAKDPLYPTFSWRDGRPALSDWFDAMLERPSVKAHYNIDYEGDTSAENFQRAVREVLELQKHSA